MHLYTKKTVRLFAACKKGKTLHQKAGDQPRLSPILKLDFLFPPFSHENKAFVELAKKTLKRTS